MKVSMKVATQKTTEVRNSTAKEQFIQHLSVGVHQYGRSGLIMISSVFHVHANPNAETNIY